MQAIERRAAL